MRRAGFALALVAAAAVAAVAQTPAQDQQFASHAAMINMAEIELGKVAADKATHAKVKAFANQMVNDHTKVLDELKTIAASKNIGLPTVLDAKHRTLRDKLAGMSDAAFDRTYIDEMVKGHHDAAAEFRKESASGVDPDLKGWAAKTLPGIESHYQMAQDVQKEVGGAKTSAIQ